MGYYEVNGVKWKQTGMVELDEGQGIRIFQIVDDQDRELVFFPFKDDSGRCFDVQITTLGEVNDPFNLEMEITSSMGGIGHNAYYSTFEFAARVANDIIRREMGTIEELFHYYDIA